ncbi:hypothetical protein G7046_g5921 [Stylonectria norvegica]|nr:hypothetical protein G7046_g5921 [Stylonectria norvegica]
MEVVAVSQALPQMLDIGGRQVQTSIIHKPLTQQGQFISLQPSGGIEDNFPAAHNGEVYAFFAHHYDYWTRELGLQRDLWDWCHWGENITFRCDEKITEADFHVGDVWKVGKEVVLKVCGSRVPCFKLAWRCGQKDSWLQPLAATGKCGIYLKIVKSGRIYPGDIAELQYKRSQQPLVDCATISRAAFADALSTRSTVDILVDDPDLLDMNKLVFRRKLSIMHDQALGGKNTWKGWRSVCVSDVVEESADIKSFHMISTNGGKGKQPLATYLPGQFVTVRLPNGLIRSWSISSYPDDSARETPQSYRISIRKQGVASDWMHENCLPGTILDIHSPAGTFVLDWSPQFPGRQVYISAGIGITPVLSMLHAHLQHQAMSRAPAVWIHIARNHESVPFRKELAQLLRNPAARELGITVKLFLTGLSPSKLQAVEAEWKKGYTSEIRFSLHAGRPTLELLTSLFVDPYYMDPLRIKPIEIEGKYSTVYLCGTRPFEKSMREILTELGVPDPMILAEAFSGDPDALATSAIEQANINFSRSGRTVAWRKDALKSATEESEVQDESCQISPGSYDQGLTLLELAEHVGMAPEFGCRTGVCGSCEVKLCKGKVTSGLQLGGMLRVCVARPASENVEIDL